MAALATESKIPVGALLVGKYRVTREIGRGGMAAVYEAEHMALGKKIAVKVLAAELAASTVVIERFFREAKAAAAVRSPYIVDVYDSGRLEDGRPFIAMEMLDGESLYERMARVRIIDIRTTVRVIMHCCTGLKKAHAAGIIHRDLKPENIFLVPGEDGDEIAKILDFGLAKFYAPVGADEKTSRLTREGAVFGTPAYMSPEQVKGQGSVDHRADLWALGCMTYECLIGRPVWNTDQGVAMTFAAIATGVLPVPSQMRPGLPLAFDEWFKKALARDPDHRFQSSKELSDALLRTFSGQALVGHSESEVKAIAALAEQLPDDSVQIQLENNPLLLAQDAPPPGPSRHNLFASASGRLPEIPAAESSTQQLSALTQARPSPLRYGISGALLLVGVVGSAAVWQKSLGPQLLTPTVASTASAATAALDVEDGGVGATDGDPKWATILADGQRYFANGDLDTALRKFKDVQDQQGGIAGKWFTDQLKLGPPAANGPCKAIAFSHPRLGITSTAGRPSISPGGKGAIVAWSDDHEQPGHEHVWSVIIDALGRPVTRPRDLTLEASDAERPSLLASGDRNVLLYWDNSGTEAGVRVRWIDEGGRIGAASVLVGGGRAGKTYFPTIDNAPDGFYVAWQDDRDSQGEDVFLRKLGPNLDPASPEIRATDYAPSRTKPASIRIPSIAIAGNALYVAYKLEEPDGKHVIERLRVPLGSPELATGLDDRRPGTPAKDRFIGDVKPVDEDRVQVDAPAIACGKDGCFVAWHGEITPKGGGGVYAALLEPSQGKVVWHKKFSDTGGHPALAVNGEGQVAVAFFDGRRVKVAMLSRENVGAPSVVARLEVDPPHDAPRPWLAGGIAKGEWWLSWQDTESAGTAASHVEPYAARLACTP